MAAAEFEQISVDVLGGEYLFRASDQIALFRGFLQVFDDMVQEEAPDPADEDPKSKLPEHMTEGMKTDLTDLLPRQHFTKPPGRFSESTLVKELESLGIGRPSTYAMIVTTVVDRKYVEQRERKLYATELGLQVNKLLVSHFPEIVNVKFTAEMEEELDTIASGKVEYLKVMKDFYGPFHHSVEKASSAATGIKKSLIEATDVICEICGKSMVIKWGRNGRFMACSGYPTCKNTKPLAEDQEKQAKIVGGKCDICGGDMVVKGGRFGMFLGCSNYPSCKNTKPISMGIKCPRCKDGDLIERKTKKGKRTFYGCSRYPECDFASWDRPVAQPCLTCGNAYIVAKYSQAKGEYLICPECKTETVKEEELAASA
jgi:DNA topoisomerase-1